jgi:hypothetical protein
MLSDFVADKAGSADAFFQRYDPNPIHGKILMTMRNISGIAISNQRFFQM